MKKIIVIGASAASVAFIAKLRSFDVQSKIICFSGEAFIPYNRCFLADFLTDDQSEQQLQLKPQDFFTKNNFDLRLNSWVTKIDTINKKICADDVWYEYDYLFLGMGSKPVIPKFMQHLKVDEVFNFHTLSDIQKIKKCIADHAPKTAVVVGAGLNGIEAASSLEQLGLKVTVVEATRTILTGQVDQEIANWLSELMRQAGVRLMIGCRVVEVEQQNNHGKKITRVILDSGVTVSTDIIVVAAGSQVNSNLLYDFDIALHNGSVVVDQHLKTNIDGVFAGGDLCVVPDMVTGNLARSTTWSDAMLQGLCAATNLSQEPRVYQGMLGLRDSYFFGLFFYGCGMTVGHSSDVQSVIKVAQHSLKKFYIQDGLLIGFVLIGDISGLSEYKMWYVTRKKVEIEHF